MAKKFKKGGLDQYGPEHFGRLIFATIRKKCETESVKLFKNMLMCISLSDVHKLTELMHRTIRLCLHF